MRTPPHLLALALFVLLAGCGTSGSDVAPVSGRVTLDGRPLEFADVIFKAEGKSPGIARTEADGRYELMYKRGVKGAPVGQNTVVITVSPDVAPNPPKLPARYNSESELQVDVVPRKENVFNFDLESK